MNSPFEIRKRWLHHSKLEDLRTTGNSVLNCYLSNMFEQRGVDKNPLVSVFTPAYKTGEKIYRPFKSLIEQKYPNWEWVIVDDSDDDGKTFNELQRLAEKDYRIKVYKPGEHSGIIGNVKYEACMLSKGQILVELDHDDELTDYALGSVVEGFNQFPEAGFLYTDCGEIFENGENATYGKNWGFGYGSYREVEYRGHVYQSSNACNINPKTIRHIVAAPNHIRAWRKDFYVSIDGHLREMHVADDYELVVRSFLNTRMVRVPRMCYIQYISQTTQRVRNKDIQRHVRLIRNRYDKRIHERLVELGCEDFMWDEKNGWSDFRIKNPEVEQHVTLTADMKE